MSPDEYCARMAAPAGSALYYALRLASPARRSAVAAVHAFCREVREVAREVSDAGVVRMKLGWWRTEIAAAFETRGQHPVAQALAPAIAAFRLPQAPFDAVIDGVASDLARATYADFEALHGHCRQVAGSVWLLCAQILSATPPAADYALDLGAALQFTASIQRLALDLRHGHLYLPQDELARFGVSVEDLQQLRATPAFAALMAHHAERVRAIYARALGALPRAERRAQRPGRVMAAIGLALLDEIERDGLRVLDRRTSLTPLTKAWIAWKTSWQR
jgi:phytoene synthase